MSTLSDSPTKPTVSIALRRLVFYGIALGVGSQIISVIISLISGSGRFSYESLTNGLGLALGCSIALMLDGKVNNKIRVAVAVVFSIAAMVALSYGASILVGP